MTTTNGTMAGSVILLTGSMVAIATGVTYWFAMTVFIAFGKSVFLYLLFLEV